MLKKFLVTLTIAALVIQASLISSMISPTLAKAASAPEILKPIFSPIVAKPGDSIDVRATVTDADGDLAAVSADFYLGGSLEDTQLLNPIGGDLYQLSYTIPSGWVDGLYDIKVAALDSLSNYVQVPVGQLTVDSTKPVAPVMNAVLPGPGDGEASLSWSAIADAVKYKIYYGKSSGVYSDNLTVMAISKVIAGLDHVSYYFTVTSFDNAGNESVYSNEVHTVPPDLIAPSTTLSANPANPDGDNNWYVTVPQIILTSSEAGTTSYHWGSNPDQAYLGSFSAPEGENLLYYHSVDTVGNVEAEKSQIFKVDTITPLAPIQPNIFVNQNMPGTDDTIFGNPGAVEPGSQIKIYADAALTQVIVDPTAKDDGGFDPISIGDNQSAQVWLATQDTAGNQSLAINLINDIVGPDSPYDLSAKTNNQKVTLTWGATADAVGYKVKYQSSQDWSEIIDVSGEKAEITGLTNGVTYTFAIAAYDYAGNLSGWVEITATPKTLIGTIKGKISEVGAAIEKITEAAKEGVAKAAESKAEENSQARNWARIVLFLSILLIAVAIGTGGYYVYAWLTNRSDGKKSEPSAKLEKDKELEESGEIEEEKDETPKGRW